MLVRIATTILLVGEYGACNRTDDVRVISSVFDPSRVRFTSYAYAPVGAFAEKRGSRMPFVDANGNGSFDSDSEASGRCDRSAQECRIDDRRIRMVMAVDDCSQTRGIWLIGDAYDSHGLRQEASLCDDNGHCSSEQPEVFQQATSLQALWLSGDSEVPRTVSLVLRVGQDEVPYPDIELPQPIQLTGFDVSRAADLRVTATADHSIDLAALTVMRGAAVQWSSSTAPETIQAKGTTLVATVPHDVLEKCGDVCEAYLQLGHVWRDDNVLSIADIRRQVF